MAAPLADPTFRRLLAAFMANGIASAIPATLVLFYIADVLQAEARQGLFLALYFIAGAAGMPLWVKLSARIGKVRAWGVAMVVAIAAFVWAAFLGAGDAAAFAVICALSGLALGADLALPPSLLADVIGRDGRMHATGTHFGLWTLATKLNLALAAGIALPLLGLSRLHARFARSRRRARAGARLRGSALRVETRRRRGASPLPNTFEESR